MKCIDFTLILLLLVEFVVGIQFELHGKSKKCFDEDLMENVEAEFTFKVVDLKKGVKSMLLTSVTDPKKNNIFRDENIKDDSFRFTTVHTGNQTTSVIVFEFELYSLRNQ
eukprot:TRINITY_DN1925_c0_g1_i1.p1 TRINITY_DN1925_c0_g1~~TRINITY_DN1925_c0_g1_i1.p1  ORF type:complete len:110 (+),score=23.87 TRINITY_DN1925_c0_g1_i1:150-479(+)